MRAMNLYPYQKLFFTTLKYGSLIPVYCGEKRKMESIGKDENILLLTGIASPEQMVTDIRPYTENIVQMNFPDHHQFTPKDINRINEEFAGMPSPKIIITTEKDNTRLFGMEGLSEEVRHSMFILPVEVCFMQEQEEMFNEKIIGYVRKNSRNSILAKAKDDNKSKNGNHLRNRPRTISFRNN